MTHKMRTLRIFVLVLATMMLLSTIAGAARVPENVYDAKDELATVDITQVYNGVETDNGVHNYDTNGSMVSITYEATLKMTEEMALYLLPRQSQLMDAKFNICIKMDLETLEFNTDPVIEFSSTFLKPQNSKLYSYKLRSYDSATRVFTYELSVSKAAAENPDNWIHKSEWSADEYAFVIPAELIVYYDGSTAYNYQEARERFADRPLMYANFSKDNWMHEIKASLADMKVKDGVSETISYNPSTWKYVEASGTVDGMFTYISDPASRIGDLVTYENLNYTTTLEFGNGREGAVLEEWTSNVVSVLLKRGTGGEAIESRPTPESPYLNLVDHFAYVIGYPDGNVHPEGTITRAEVATIFFRMLTDDVRNAYWSKTNDYSDVNENDWYNNAVSTLSNLGAIEGYSDGTFRPNANITRAEFATIAVRFFELTDAYKDVPDAFTDIAEHWANDYINIAYLLGIIDGYPDGTYLPAKAISRAEAMTIVNNTLRRTPCNEGLLPVNVMITWPDNMDTTQWYYAEVQEATNSHEYEYFSNGREKWTAELPVRDWAAFEKAWSEANAAYNPGEVVSGN